MISNLACHVPMLASRAFAPARCFLISTTQHASGFGQAWRVTTSPCPVQVLEGDGEWYEYSPTIGMIADSTERLRQLGRSSTVIYLSTQDDPDFDVDDGRRGLLESSLVYEFDVDWREPWNPPLRVFRWRVAECDPEANRVRLTLVGMSGDLERDAGHAFAPGCFNEFGDARCNKGSSISGNSNFRYRLYKVSSATTPSRKEFTIEEDTDTFPAAALSGADWWARGLCNFTSGRCAPLRAVIYGNDTPSGSGPATALVRLVTPLPFAPTAGDTVQVRVGCDRKSATCSTKFANLDNFNGFDFQPGGDTIRKTPESR